MYVHYQMEKVLLVSKFGDNFGHEEALNFARYLFCFFWNDCMVLSTYFVNMVNWSTLYQLHLRLHSLKKLDLIDLI